MLGEATRAIFFKVGAEVKARLEQIHLKHAEQQPSTAVLPFANLSTDKENEYFSDGLAEEIINALAHIRGLQVIARTSAFVFRGKERDITKIAEALRVRTILEGNVRRTGNSIQVETQLTSVEDGSHLWSGRYDGEMTDVFAIQGEITAAIAAALQVKLSVQPAALRQYTPNLPAYEALMRARYDFNKLTPEPMVRSREWLEEAIALDPGYALPHCELGVYFFTLAMYGMLPTRKAMPLARAAVQKALNLDPSLPEALAVLGRIAAVYDYDWKEADRLFRLAMAQERVPPWVRRFFASYLLLVNRPGTAIEEMEHALQEDPLNRYFRYTLAVSLLMGGREADAAMELRRIIVLDENYYLSYYLLASISWQQGNLEKALTFAEKANSLAPWSLPANGMLAGLLMRSGDSDRAGKLFQKLGDGKGCGGPLAFFFYHLLCSEIDEAADWAEKAIEEREARILLSLLMSPAKELRSSSRWPALAKMMNLPEAWLASVR
jgi:TolB-like protein/Tfp pilus assembly protein PilF